MDSLLRSLERDFDALTISSVSETGKVLGRGSYGEVREASWLGRPCATKRVHPSLVPQVGAAEVNTVSRDFVRECQTWKDLRHPNIVQLLGVVFDPTSPLPVLVMERLNTSLRHFLKDHTRDQFPINRKVDVLHQVALGLAYLHRLKHIHRDLSTNNILLDTDNWRAAKITDFGVARVIDTTRSRMTGTQVPGTPDFMPPEMFQNPAQFSDKVDVFSFGCVIISTLIHQWPEPGPAKCREGGRLVGLTEYQRREHHLALLTPDERALSLRIIDWCLQEEPSSRPSSMDIVEELARIQEEARKGSKGEASGSTVLLSVAYGGSVDLMKTLLQEHSCSLDEVDNDGSNAMHKAAEGGQLEMVKFLAPIFGARINEKNKDSFTILHLAAQEGHCDVARYLLEKLKMDPLERDKSGATILLRAAYGGNVDLVKMLLEGYECSLDEVDNDSSNAMHKAAEGGQLEMIKFLAPIFGTRIREKNKQSHTVLHLAAQNGHYVVARYLIKKLRMDPLDKDKDGRNALHLAAYFGHLEVVKYLLRKVGGNKSDSNNFGCTCLDEAIQQNNEDVVAYLLDKGGFVTHQQQCVLQ